MPNVEDPNYIDPDVEIIEVVINEVPTPVSKREWDEDQTKAIEEVEAARAAYRFDAVTMVESPDYNKYVEIYGEDGEPDDDVE